ncbi:hypothetical protein [Chitinimonas lacunae]|uniref:DUF2987 domain-containing protein n=1 Tax=Chitinimonas lacunae TaxID=1963018 RepID=A0ABV8MNQ9_9NEIS
MPRLPTALILSFGLFAPLPVFAATKPTVEKGEKLEVQMVRDPAWMPYEKAYDLASRFKDSPYKSVMIRFRLMPTRPGDNLQGLALHLYGKTTDIAIDIDQDGFFDVPLDAQALAENAEFVANRKAGSLRWLFFPLIRSSGERQYRLAHLRNAAAEAQEAVSLMPWSARARLALKMVKGVVFEFAEPDATASIDLGGGRRQTLAMQDRRIALKFDQFAQASDARIELSAKPIAIHPDFQ